MCIAAPAKVVEINREKESLFADFGGVRQEAKINLLPDVEIGDYGEEFVIRRKIDGRKYDENDRTTYNIYHVKVNDCKISRQCDFDINRLDFGLDNKKKNYWWRKQKYKYFILQKLYENR